MSLKDIFRLGFGVLANLEQLHEAGYTFNDLKPDNILLGQYRQNLGENLESVEVHLIDFGSAERYMESDIHIE